jgi:hypothetical protein
VMIATLSLSRTLTLLRSDHEIVGQCRCAPSAHHGGFR